MTYPIEELPAFRTVGITATDTRWEMRTAGEKAVQLWDRRGSRLHQVPDRMDNSQPSVRTFRHFIS